MSMLGISETEHKIQENMNDAGSKGIGSRLLRIRSNITNYSNDNDTLHRLNRRNIARPKKHDTFSFDTNSSKAIEQIYLNKKLGRVKITKLETIFEEANLSVNGELNAAAATISPTMFGLRKLKRSLTFTDGFKANKALKEKRKRRVKSLLGVAKRLKKVSMKYFLEHLETLNGPSDTIIPADISCDIIQDSMNSNIINIQKK